MFIFVLFLSAGVLFDSAFSLWVSLGSQLPKRNTMSLWRKYNVLCLMKKKTVKPNIFCQTKDIPEIVRFAGSFFVILFTLGLFSNVRWIKASTKNKYGKLLLGTLSKVRKVYNLTCYIKKIKCKRIQFYVPLQINNFLIILSWKRSVLTWWKKQVSE